MTDPRREPLILPRWAPYLVLLPLAIVAVDGLLGVQFGWHDPVKDVTSKLAAPRAEAMGRTRVLAALLPFMLIASLMTIQLVREFMTLMGPRMRRRLAPAVLLWTATAAAVSGTQMAGLNPPEHAVGSNFVDVAFGAIRTSGSGATLREVLDLLVSIFRVLLSFGAGAAIIGTISCLAQPDPSLPLRTQREYREAQRARLDGYLYASALLLVTGLFFIDSCYRWPAPFSTQPAQYLDHVNAIMLRDGIFYSTIIASYYVPVAALTGRFGGDRTGAASAGDGAAAAGLSAAGLIKAFVALISPAVAGLLTQLLEGLG